MTTTTTPSRAFVANFLSGPLVTSALLALPIAAFTVAVVLMDKKLPWTDAFRVMGVWPMTTGLFFLSGVAAALASALYASLHVKRRGTYSIPLAITIAMTVAFFVAGGRFGDVPNVSLVLNSMLFAALGAAMAGWLARKSGASWRFP
jgi:hypothetical protein